MKENWPKPNPPPPSQWREAPPLPKGAMSGMVQAECRAHGMTKKKKTIHNSHSFTIQIQFKAIKSFLKPFVRSFTWNPFELPNLGLLLYVATICCSDPSSFFFLASCASVSSMPRSSSRFLGYRFRFVGFSRASLNEKNC